MWKLLEQITQELMKPLYGANLYRGCTEACVF